MAKEIISWLKAIVIAVVIVFVVRSFVVTPSIVKGESMEPNLSDGDRIIISKMSSIDRLDVIAFNAPSPYQDDNYVKRIIGLPGDKIEIDDQQLYINGLAFDEYYLAEFDEYQIMSSDFSLEKIGHVEIPEGTYFVMGDNRSRSWDSRDFGLINEESIIGEVVFRFWPLDSIGFFQHE